MAEIKFNRNQPAYIEDLEMISEMVPWESLRNKKIAVTGATGLLGSLIVDFLLYLNKNYGANISIVALGRNLEKIRIRFSFVEDNNLLKIEKFELTKEFPDIEVDYIVHCAGNSHPKLFAEDPVGTLMGNILGAENVLKSAVKKDAKVLILSSGEVYGENQSENFLMDEKYTGKLDLSSSRSCYTEGKRGVEALTQSYITQYGATAVIARPCRIFGPTMTSADNKASAQFIRSGLESKDIILKSDGEQQFSYIYSADAVSALLTILIKGQSGEAYNVANNKCHIHLKDFAKEVAKIAKVKLKFDITGEPGGSKVKNALLSTEKLQSLGWSSLYNLSQGLNQTFKILATNEN